MTYDAGTGERLDATFTEAEDGVLTVVDPQSITVAEGCTAVDESRARCALSDPSINSAFVQVKARGGDGDDRLVASRRLFLPELDGGAGNDVLVGRGTLVGGAGDDALDGLGEYIARLVGGPGADRLANGTVDYSERRAAVRFDASRVGSAAGEAGEGDIVGPGVVGIFGGAGPDVLGAGVRRTGIDGGPGNDTLTGGTGEDNLAGGGGSDRLDGRGGNDELAGGGSSADRDVLRGGSGRDSFALTASREVVDGGAGSDRVERPGVGDVVTLRDATRDDIDCSLGRSGRAPMLLLDRLDVALGGVAVSGAPPRPCRGCAPQATDTRPKALPACRSPAPTTDAAGARS